MANHYGTAAGVAKHSATAHREEPLIMISAAAAEEDALAAAVMPSRAAIERRVRIVLAALGCIVLAVAAAYAGRARRDAMLAEAVVRGDARSASLLLSAGAHADTREPATGKPLIEQAILQPTPAVAVALIEALAAKGADPAPAAAEAARRGRVELVKELLVRRPELAQGYSGGKMLCAAAQGGDIPTLRTVLAHRGNTPLDWATPDPAHERGMTPLLYAARSGRPAPIYLLARTGANLKARCGVDGRTSLMVAALWNDPESCRFLAANGVGIEDRDTEGRTALMLAASAGRYPTLDYLLKAKADPNRRDIKGKTALALAIEGGVADDRVLNRLRHAGGHL